MLSAFGPWTLHPPHSTMHPAPHHHLQATSCSDSSGTRLVYATTARGRLRAGAHTAQDLRASGLRTRNPRPAPSWLRRAAVPRRCAQLRVAPPHAFYSLFSPALRRPESVLCSFSTDAAVPLNDTTAPAGARAPSRGSRRRVSNRTLPLCPPPAAPSKPHHQLVASTLASAIDVRPNTR